MPRRGWSSFDVFDFKLNGGTTMRKLLASVGVLLGAYGQPAGARDDWFSSIFEQSGNGTQRPIQSAAPQAGRQSVIDLKQSAVAGRSAWRMLRSSWNQRDEADYEEFVRRIGESGCRSVHECLTSPQANPLYQASNPPAMPFYADCADLPYMFRAYYAWKNGLPFSYSTAVAPLGPSRDIRYTARGNKIVARRDLVDASIDARRVIPEMVDTISSAHYRYPPRSEGEHLPDHYPVRIARESIKPGTIVYDANGHVAVVYKVTPEGRIHYMDSHPDNSLTRSVYGKSFSRASPAMGAGFKRWRPQTLVGAARAPDGSFRGGRIVLSADAQIADWSDEQFFGTEATHSKDWRKAQFILEGQALDFHDYVRKRLANAGFKYDPVDETRSMVRTLCNDIKYRVDAVDFAIKAGIHLRPPPDRLPNNIYATEGDWEVYSTPSRDARLRTAFKELRDEVARFLALAAAEPEALAYAGNDLRHDLLSVYREETGACTITYMRSDGSEKQLPYDEIMQRLFFLSFDPHHCVELRWGARDAEDLASCPGGPAKRLWHDAEQRLRNQLDRTYDVRMGFSLAELRRGVAGSGVDTPPDIDVLTLLLDHSR